MLSVTATYVGGPTALLEIAGLRLLTDPTFDQAGTDYPTPAHTLHKTSDPAVAADAIGPIDAVLLSHDHHADNLDRAGRALLARAARVLAPPEGARRLGGNALGVSPWNCEELVAADGKRLRIMGTPARHGPPDGDRGPVTGFLITDGASPDRTDSPAIYVSGDTVWYDRIEEIAMRAEVRIALLNMGAARVPEVGPAHLTFTADEGVLVARAMPHALIVPLHYEGWGHFSEGRAEIDGAFRRAGIGDRLRWLAAGQPTALG